MWPEPKIIKNKRLRKEKIPSVVTSKDWQIYYEKKENEKKDKEEEKIKRAEERKKKKELLEQLKFQKINRKIKENKEQSNRHEKKKKSRLYNKRDISSDSEASQEWEESEHNSDDDISFSDIENRENYKENDYIIVSFPGKKNL